MESLEPARTQVDSSIVRRGVVAVIVRDGRMLIMRRSQTVAAPGKLCFPGGGIEPGESEIQALQRELWEELCLRNTRPQVRIWETVTPFRIHLAWWYTEVDDLDSLAANPEEVAEVHWMTPAELRIRDDGLVSNNAFLDAFYRGDIELSIAGLNSAI